MEMPETISLKELFLIVEDESGNKYGVNTAIKELVKDWESKCNFVPSNDSPVYACIHNNRSVNVGETTFGDLMNIITAFSEFFFDR